MATLTETLDQLVESLKAAGVPASLEPGDVAVPGAWIVPTTASYPRMVGVRWRVDVLLIVEGGSERESLKALEDLHGRVVPALLVPDDDPEFVAVALPADPAAGLPALRLPVDVDL